MQRAQRRAPRGRASASPRQRLAVAAQPGQVGRPSPSGRPVYQRSASGSRRRRSAIRWAVKSISASSARDQSIQVIGVVLAVGVVVAALAVAEFVAGGQHRRALRQQQCGQQGALQARAQRLHLGVVGRAFDAAVPAEVVAVAVAVVLAVGLVVALVVADQVAQREAVVRDDVVDRLGRRAAALLEQVGRRRTAAARTRRACSRRPARSARMVSRKRSFHSSQPRGKRPTW